MKIAPNGRYRAFDADGNPLAGGQLFTYVAGTTTPKATYLDKAGASTNTNPVILDADGYADVWLDTGGYKFVLKDADSVTLWTTDNVDGGSTSGFASAVVSKSSSFSMTENELNNVVVCTSAITIGLLPAATAGEGYAAIVINQSSGNVTIDPDGSETINGTSSVVVPVDGSVTIHCDGERWYAPGLSSGSINVPMLNAALAASLVPTGALVPFGGASAPTGWLLCGGQAISRTSYADLFTVIGTTYGSGDGLTTFNLPDLRGRAPFGVDNMGGTAANRITSAVSGITGTTLGAVGGDQAMQTHSHGVTDPGHTHGIRGHSGSGFSASSGVNHYLNADVVTASATTGITINNYGAGSSQNVPPAIILNFIIKT